MDSIRQKIISNMDTRFKTILVANGYQTNIGQHIFWWKKFPLGMADLPGMNCKDRTNARSEGAGVYLNSMMVEIEAGEKGSSTPETLRKILADIEKAIFTDPYWGEQAQTTVMGDDSMNVEEDEKRIGGIRTILTIEYTTVIGDPFTKG